MGGRHGLIQFSSIVKSKRQVWQWRIIGTLWLTYCLFYLGRLNLSVALPVIEQELGWNTITTGIVSSVFFWVYAFGQLINGSLGDRLSARLFIFLGLLGTAFCNLMFGFAGTVAAMSVIWGLNGIFQSTGWGPIVKTASAWTENHQRNTVSAILGTSFVFGALVTWWLSGQIIAAFGRWQFAFWVPAAVLFAHAVLWVVSIRDNPQQVGFELSTQPAVPETKPSLASMVRETSGFLRQPYLLLLAVTTLFQGMIKDGINLWMPALLMKTQGLEIDSAVGYSLIVPLMGFAGVLIAGWLNNLIGDDRKTIIGLFSGGSLAAAGVVAAFSAESALVLSLLIGLCSLIVNGINVVLLSTIPMRFDGKSSTIAGFLDFASYVGSALMTIITGLVADIWGWVAVAVLWAVLFVLGAVTMFANSYVSKKSV